jgi:hypothetical protein
MSGRGRGSGNGRGNGYSLGSGRGSGRGNTNHPVVSTLMELMPQVAATGNTSFTCMLAELINQAQIEFNASRRQPEPNVSRAPHRREILNKSIDTSDSDKSDRITQFKRILELVDNTTTKSMWTDTLASEYLSTYGVELNMYGYTLPALIRNTRGVNGVTSKNYPGRFFIAVKGDPRDEPEVSDDEQEVSDDEQVTFTPKTPEATDTTETVETTETDS